MLHKLVFTINWFDKIQYQQYPLELEENIFGKINVLHLQNTTVTISLKITLLLKFKKDQGVQIYFNLS